MTDQLKCPICDKPLQPDDLCASDIEMGACHAECLEGSTVVDLDTGEETPDAKVDTFRAREIMEPGRQQRDKFEAAVVRRLQESGFLEVEIRTECLARVGQGYQDEVINAGWHYWNEALWQNIPLIDPGFGQGPDGLDFATPDEVFDKGPEAVREWQEARGRKPQTPPPSTHVLGLSDAQVDAVLHLVESRLCIIWPKIGAREEFANLLRVLEPAPEEELEMCEACGEPFEDGDLVYWMADDTGHIHADCCGPERESYVGPDGAPLKDGDPIPEPFAYRDPRAATESQP